MDYFKQRRAYRDKKLYEISITANQNNLYRELLDYGNDRSDLNDYFHLKNDALLSMTGMSKSTFIDSRRSLVQMNLIDYKKGRKDKDAPEYKIVKLYQDFTGTKNTQKFVPNKNTGTKNVKKSVPTSVPDPVPNPVPETAPKSTSTIHDLTNTKHHLSDDDDSFKNLITIYQQNIGVTTPVIIENIRYAINDFKEHENTEQQAIEIVEEAIRITAVNNAHSWKYTNKILMNWLNDSLFTLPNIKAAQNKPKSNSFGKPKRVEQATDWSKYSAGKQTQTSKNTEIPDDMKQKLAEMRNKENVTK
ncbi:hypothetical protein CPR19088_GLDEOEPO_01375 [Companilactobacillus paralimentarius]